MSSAAVAADCTYQEEHSAVHLLPDVKVAARPSLYISTTVQRYKCTSVPSCEGGSTAQSPLSPVPVDLLKCSFVHCSSPHSSVDTLTAR